MLINNIDISSLDIQLYDRVITSNDITTHEEWLDGDIQPTFIRQQDGFKTINLTFLILCQEEEEAFLKISRLTQMLKKATIQFEDINLTFDVSLQGAAEPERLKNGSFTVAYELSSSYGRGNREIYTTNANLTNSFKLTVLYYQNNSTLLATDSITIRASSFTGDEDSLNSIGVDLDKYLPKYYMNGVATNLNGLELTYENLRTLNTLIINYAPIRYNLDIHYFMGDSQGYYNELFEEPIQFTYPQLQSISSIGELIDIRKYKPDGYKAKVQYNGALTVEELLLASPIYVYYSQIENEQSKNIVVNYKHELDDGTFSDSDPSIINVKETDFIEGMKLKDFIPINGKKPAGNYYGDGYIVDASGEDLITYETIETVYTVHYPRVENTIFVEYYVGTYPSWSRLTSITIKTKYKEAYDTSFNLVQDLNINLDRYHTSEYQSGQLYNADSITSYEDVLNTGVLQVYYVPIDYTITVGYYKEEDRLTALGTDTITINALMFLNNPILSDIIPITKYRPEGYQYNNLLSYQGEITLSALTQASPIVIIYSEIQEVKTKNIIVKYKKELSSAYTVINTSLITVNEADCVGGVRLKDIINLNLYKPDYYENGIIDGVSSTVLTDFNNLSSIYEVLYLASTYNTPVRYYTDEVDDLNWIGSANISYRIIDFETTTTLYDLGLNINAFKPAYCGDGQLQYNGPINFSALLELPAINVVYDTEITPPDPGDIDYPHRFLFLQHNDLKNYEYLHPEWTLNHAYINTGVSVEDMSKLTVIMECGRVDDYVPLHNVNAGYAYLFGSTSVLGSYFMRFNNQTQYGSNLTGVNTYEARAGSKSDMLTLTEEKAIGFSKSSGIYSTAQAGYSNVIFTYTNKLATDGAQMPYPLYLFANNNGGSYADGLAGIGIYSCRIYYEDKLIRDFIPVQFYDKIGDLVAPSNCLYDKISKTFFEDGTKLNSFNIRDDERYTDTNLEHQIGHCYVRYFKNDTLFQTIPVWFRGNDFGEGKTWDPYVNFQVDKYQPPYYSAGSIKQIDGDFIVNFDNLNNKTFDVVYKELENTITVKYIKEDADGTQTVLAEENRTIREKDFYQVPTFGDIVRINKYKPDGYQTDFVYPDTRVSLKRVVDNSPYTIIYKPITEEITTYTTIVKYIKKVFGIRTYETLGTKVLTFDQSNFRDGEYIDFYINFNEMKPEKYYLDGETYQWYPMDERIDTPDKLKDMYIIAYQPETQYLTINYYIDKVEEGTEIASTTWDYKIDSYEYPIQMVDTLPNDYINRYKPVRCAGGVFENPEANYTFEQLAELASVNIIYVSLEEPHNPEAQYWESKVLYWGDDRTPSGNGIMGQLEAVAGKIPYIDLGYQPKEIGRLRVEMKAQIIPLGYTTANFGANDDGIWCSYASQSLGYLPVFGYYTPEVFPRGKNVPVGELEYTSPIGETFEKYGTVYSRKSKGAFAIRGRLPVCSGWVYTADGPQFLDGQSWYKPGSGVSSFAGDPPMTKIGIQTAFRRGIRKTKDDNYEDLDAFYDYGFAVEDNLPKAQGDSSSQYGWPVCLNRTGVPGEKVNDATISPIGNPYTIIIDAFNNYYSFYSEATSNTPVSQQIENTDNDFFEGREQPKGTLSLFQATDPNTGKVNIMPFNSMIFPSISPVGTPAGLQGSMTKNPYESGLGYGSISYTTMVGTGTDASGNVIYTQTTTTRNVQYARFPIPEFPQTNGCYIWNIKIYDRDRLVRDLIPVAEGDKVYNYTMPANGLFDKITEIFFGNGNKGGTYSYKISGINQGIIGVADATQTIKAEQILPLKTMYDPLIYGKITVNYYDYDNKFIANQFVDVPTWFNSKNEKLEDILHFNDYKPDEFHLDGMIDLDKDLSFETMSLKEIYELGTVNIYYKLRSFTKTICYYYDNYRVASKDIFYSIKDIENAKNLTDLGIDVDLYWNENFKHGKIVFNENIIANDDIKAFIDAPSPIVVYEKLSAEEAPNILYEEYYRGGAYDE